MDALNPYWFELALVFFVFAVGNILMGHFEERTPKWRRLGKVFVVGVVSVVVSATAGRAWFFGLLGVMSVTVVVIHAWLLPRKGINGWTALPREKYYALRGWKLD